MVAILEFVETYSRQQEQYKRIEKEVETLCRTLLDGKIKFSWQSRVKEAESLGQKLEKRRHKYRNDDDNVNDVKDLVAGRVILTRWKDFTLVEQAIEEAFHIDDRSQHPKPGQGHLEQRFRGYDGLHFYVRRRVPSHEPHSNLLIEIQLQSAFMWAFSTLEHDIIYKQLHGHPDPVLVSNLEILKGIANLGEVALEQYDELLSSDTNSPFPQGPNDRPNLSLLIGQFAQDKKDAISRKIGEQRQNKKVIAWVSNADPARDHNQVRTTLGSPYHNSGQRFRPIYDAWISSPQTLIFWLCGAVGTGKSSLVSRVIEWHSTAVESRQKEGFAFYYCSRKSGKRTTPLEVLRSLIAQLAASKDFSSVSRLVAKKYEDCPERPIEIQECPELLSGLVNEYQKFTFIIDALDECDDVDALLLRLRVLNNKIEEAQTPVKFFFSSRKQVEVDSFFKRCEKLELGSGTDLMMEDMRIFINTQIKEREILCLGSRLLHGRYPHLEEELIEVLYHQSQGMFIWVKLQLELFLGPRSRLRHQKDVRKKIDLLKVGNETPKIAKLNQVYDELYNFNTEKGSPSRCMADRVFRWMICAQRSLFMTELVEAASIDDDGNEDEIQTEDLLQICSNFIVCDELDMVHFPHASAQDYLQQKLDRTKGFSSDQRQISIAQICLLSLTHHENGIKGFKELQRNLHGYSVVYWANHLSKVDVGKRPPSLQHLCKKVFSENDRNVLAMPHEKSKSLQHRHEDPSRKNTESILVSWLKLLPKIQDRVGRLDLDQKIRLQNCISDPPNSLFAACIFGLVELIPKTLSVTGADQPNPEGSSPLWLASKYVSYDVVTALLGKGAEVDARDRIGHTALMEASVNGDERIVLSLLEKKASVNIWLAHYGSALSKALENRHEKVARLLLQHNADTSTRNELRQTALLKASAEGYEDAVRFLLQADADVEARDGGYHTSLTAASEKGHKEIVHMLLQHGAQVDPQYSRAPTALYLASENGHDKVVALLLENNADVNTQSGKHYTPLIAASVSGHEATARLLLSEPDLDFKTQKQGRVALKYALECGHAQIARMLLEEDIINGRQSLLNTALLYAAGDRYAVTIQPLLERIAGNSQEEPAQSLMLAGLEKDQTKVMQTLLDMGADINVDGDCGGEAFYGTVLQYASHVGNKTIVQLLLKCPGININAQRWTGSALHQASKNGHDEVLHLLLDRADIAVNDHDGNDNTPLSLASSKGFENTVRLLLDHPDIDVNAPCYWGTALHVSLVYGVTRVSQLLLSQAHIDVNARGLHGSPLQMVEELTTVYSDDDSAPEDPGAPYNEILALLLEKGATHPPPPPRVRKSRRGESLEPAPRRRPALRAWRHLAPHTIIPPGRCRRARSTPRHATTTAVLARAAAAAAAAHTTEQQRPLETQTMTPDIHTSPDPASGSMPQQSPIDPGGVGGEGDGLRYPPAAAAVDTETRRGSTEIPKALRPSYELVEYWERFREDVLGQGGNEDEERGEERAKVGAGGEDRHEHFYAAESLSCLDPEGMNASQRRWYFS